MRLDPRTTIASFVFVLAACPPPLSNDGYLRVDVRTSPSSRAACLRVVVQPTNGAPVRSGPIPRSAGDEGPFVVAVYQDDLGPEVSVEAIGYSDAAGCDTELVPPERSQRPVVQFSPREIKIVELLVGGEDADAGFDAGADGGVDAGRDAGLIDRDGDQSPANVDCDDQDPARAPTLPELCADAIDNDCDQQVDCADAQCANQPCALGGTCLNGVCAGATSEVCTDGVDNDRDSLADCFDPDCASQLCNDGDGCTVGERCVSNSCTGGSARDCSASLPMCMVNAGCDAGVCLLGYAPPSTGACDDGFACTLADACDGDGGCEGSTKVCPASSNACLLPACSEPSGACGFTVDTGAGCDDLDPCTRADQCQADGGCAGTVIQCPVQTECQLGGSCSNGSCSYMVRTGACDGGTCNSLGQCVPTATVFPYAPSNFTEAQLAGLSSPTITITCPITIDTQSTDGGVSITPQSCAAPGFGTAVIALSGSSISAALVVAQDLNVNAAVTVVGARPLIIVARGSASVTAPITTSAGGDLDCAFALKNGGILVRGGGGGGGGFGSTGGNGAWAGLNAGGAGQGVSGSPTLVPLRGGCSGGLGGGGAAGGRGGGAVQLSVAETLTIDSRIAASGGGGAGAPVIGRGGGGGGGGSGGAVLLEAQRLVLNASAVIVANGGGGGEGAQTTVGNAGADGLASTARAGGGSGGSNCGGNGGAGGARAGAASSGSPPGGTGCGQKGGGGAGGGGVGIIRFNALTSCSVAGQAVVSPAQSGNGPGCQ